MQLLAEFSSNRSRIIYTRPGPHRVTMGGVQQLIEGPEFRRFIFTPQGDIWSFEYVQESKGRGRDFSHCARAPYRRAFLPIAYFSYDRYNDPLVVAHQSIRRVNRLGGISTTVLVDGEIVTVKVESVDPTSRVLNQYEYDLTKSGNLVRYIAESASMNRLGDHGGEVVDIEYAFVDGCYVPQKWTRTNVSAAGQQKYTEEVTFSNQQVNIAIDEHAFTPLGLGMRPGDRLDDEISDKRFYYEQVVENPTLSGQ